MVSYLPILSEIRQKEVVILILCLLIGFTLRFYHFDQKSLWMDEIYTFNDSSYDVKDQLKYYKGTFVAYKMGNLVGQSANKRALEIRASSYYYGPVSVKQLLKAEISMKDEPKALLKVKVADKTISILEGRGAGTLLTSLENLDKIYELAEGTS
jgi:hypothetical protein